MIGFGIGLVSRRSRRATGLVTAIATLVLIGGCTATASPSPAGSEAASSPGVAAASPVVSTAPSPTPISTPAASPTPAASTLPTVGAAPDGPWTSVRWIDLGHALPTLATAQSQTSETTLYGWSGGYAAFASDGGADSETNAPPTLVSTSSADGVNWTPATPIDLGSEKNEILIDQIAEGPAGLVAAGRYQPATCGGPETIAALWHSDDGIAWTPMAMSKEMTKGRVFTLDGGPAGYVATGVLRDGTTPGIWLTTDATTWRSLPLPKPPSGRLVVNDASSFAGGLAVGGAVIGPEGCGGASAIHPAVWASTDGTSWTRQTLPGASTGANASIQVRSLNEAEVVAVDTTGDTPKAWVSTDGRTWTSVGTPTDDALYNEVTDNRHVLSVSTPDSDQGPMKIEAIGDRLDGSTITQSGDVPMMTPDSFGLIPAVGPTGLVLMTTDGSRLWLGVPSGS